MLANGLLLLLPRGFQRDGSSLRLVAVGFAALLALTTYLIAARRQRTLAKHPLPSHISPRRDFYLVGSSIAVLIVIAALSVAV